MFDLELGYFERTCPSGSENSVGETAIIVKFSIQTEPVFVAEVYLAAETFVSVGTAYETVTAVFGSQLVA